MKHFISIFCFLFGVCGFIPLNAQSRQTADSAYTRPLKDVLSDIEKQFGVSITYNTKLVDGKMLNYADWRIKPWSLEETLQSVLAPFDYNFANDNGRYRIRTYEYSRTFTSEGEKWLNYFKTRYSNREEWENRKSEILPCLREALKISPIPERPQSSVILAKKRKYDGYTVENFAIETLPGIYVAGSIYRPSKFKGKIPVMLNPNGHFAAGRYNKDLQVRYAALARMGCVSVSWDIFAWGESSLQFEGELHHLSVANTIQTLNVLRILDYILSLNEVDSTRVGITGGSGGGSLTMMIAAIDPRITISIPVVMLSSHFSGGCPCEVGMPAHLCANRTNNVEIAAMFAPKPLLILSDGKDWTYSVPELEYPFVKRTYAFYNAENQVENIHFPDEGHDYGASKRAAMYEFVARHFGLDLQHADESKVTIENENQLKIFGENGEKLPANAIHGKEELSSVLKSMGIY